MRISYCSKRIVRTGALLAASCFWAVSGLAGTSAEKIPPAAKIPPTLLMNGRMLAESKQRILAGDAALQPAFSNPVSYTHLTLPTNREV